MATFLVTGANRGIGLEFARQLAARGETVLGTARNPDQATDLAQTAEVHALDVANSDSIAKLGGRLAGRSIDVLINNAGVFPDRGQDLQNFDAEALMDCYRVNALGPLLTLRAVLPQLQDGHRRLCVNITSQMGSIARLVESGNGADFAYRSSKSALNMNMSIAANELRASGITIINLHPGWVQTDMGGQEATLTCAESVTRMLSVIDSITPSRTGEFLDPDGNKLPW